MNERTSDERLFGWRPSFYVAIATFLATVGLLVWERDGGFISIFLFGSLICALAGVWLLAALLHRRFRLCASIIFMFASFLVTAVAVLNAGAVLRPSVRWFFRSRHYKAQLMAKPTPTNGGLRHVEWESWGFAGAGYTTAYLVFDPSDSLAMAAERDGSVKFPGIPCEASMARRLEKQWYEVVFYTDQDWTQCR